MDFKKAIDRFRDINGLVMTGALALIILDLTIQVIARSFFGTAFAWVEETARYLFIWMVLGSAVLAYNRNLFVAVDIYSKFMSQKVKFTAQIIVHLVELFFFIFVLIASVEFMHFAKGQMTPAMRIPIGYIYFCFPLFFAQFSLSALLKIISAIKRGPEC